MRQAFEQNQQVRGYYSVADVLDVDHYKINGADRALVLGVRELDQNGINDGDQNWLNLHTVYTHGNGMIAAYANQRDGDEPDARTGSDSDDDRPSGPRATQPARTDLGDAVGGYEDRVYFGEDSPDYSVSSAEAPGSARRRVDLRRHRRPPTARRGRRTLEGSEATTTYDGAGGVPVGSTFRQLLYAIKFG